MIKIENVSAAGLEPAVRGMRNPRNSWELSDSCLCDGDDCHVNPCGTCPRENIDDTDYAVFCLGKDDFNLMQRLARAGTDHRKYMRMIVVYADITAPLYWWKEADQYKVGTVTNSCSTMNKIHAKEFVLEDFSHEHLIVAGLNSLKRTINDLNDCREGYFNEEISKNPEWRKEVWWQMIQLLPSSYNQRRTMMMNYEVLANIYHARRNHKLDEWRQFCQWIESLPYSEIITGAKNGAE